MLPYFLDTSFIIALEDADDENHEKAISFWKSFVKKPKPLITTSYIFDEVVTFVKRRIGFLKAVEIGNRILLSPSVDLIHISQEEFEKAWEMFLFYKDKKYSFTDCLSFLVMEKRELREVLTFDQHFKQMGFKILP